MFYPEDSVSSCAIASFLLLLDLDELAFLRKIANNGLQRGVVTLWRLHRSIFWKLHFIIFYKRLGVKFWGELGTGIKR
jgi:hypothetical protein